MSVLLEFGGLAGASQRALGQRVAGIFAQILLIALDGEGILALTVLCLCQTQQYGAVGIAVAQRVLICGGGAGVLPS